MDVGALPEHRQAAVDAEDRMHDGAEARRLRRRQQLVRRARRRQRRGCVPAADAVANPTTVLARPRSFPGAQYRGRAGGTTPRIPTLPSLITPTSQWSLPGARYERSPLVIEARPVPEPASHPSKPSRLLKKSRVRL